MTQELLRYFRGDELAAQAWANKYALDGEITPDDMHKRMALEYAKIELKFLKEDEYLSKKIPMLSDYGQQRFGDLKYLINTQGTGENASINIANNYILPHFNGFKDIIPGGSIMANLGKTSPTSLSNCFVLGQPEDNIESIFNYARDAAQLYKRRGGVGIDISFLRPRNAEVNNASRTSTGSVSFMDLYSEVTKLIGQEGRRGALMLSIDVNHPDVLEFITVKQDLTKVTGANVSIKTNAKFMQAVKDDTDYILRFPCDQPAAILHGQLQYNVLVYDNFANQYCKKVKAREVWNTMIEAAHKSAEPGILFWDKHLEQDPAAVYEEYTPVSTNPCGEIPLQPKDSCRLSAVNLYNLVQKPFEKDAYLDMERAYSLFYEQLILSDNLVELEIEAIGRILAKIDDIHSEEFKLWLDVMNTGRNSRRVGNGFTALADMFAALGVKYGDNISKGGFGDLMRIKLMAEMDATIDLAILRGEFKGYDSMKEYSITEKGELKGNNKFYQHILDIYPEGVQKMVRFGRRNVSWSTIAPTGTVSLMAQVSSGIEPVFSPYYVRRMKVANKEEATFTDVDGQMFKEFVVVHPKLMEFSRITHNTDLSIEHDEAFWKEEYESSPYFEACSADLNWKDRLAIQQIAQRKTTHSISSTLNLPSDVSINDVDEIYKSAYNIGLKGITIYRDGSRGGILVNKETKNDSVLFTTNRAPKRPKTLNADVYTLTNSGIKYAVMVGLFHNKPYEIFVQEIAKEVTIKDTKGVITKVGKGHYQFVGESYTCDNIQNTGNMEKKATALYVSMLLRTGANLKFIIKTAKKVDDNIASFTSAMCRVLAKYVEKEVKEGEVCPDCGGKIIHEAGCEKCESCSYSKCLMIHKSIN